MLKLKRNSEIQEVKTFATPEDIQDMLYIKWSSMKIIDDDDEVLIDFDLPPIIPVIIKVRKRKEGRSEIRQRNGRKKL